jgi:hypothetical protein
MLWKGVGMAEITSRQELTSGELIDAVLPSGAAETEQQEIAVYDGVIT